MGKQIVVCHLPWSGDRSWGADHSLPLVLLPCSTILYRASLNRHLRRAVCSPSLPAQRPAPVHLTGTAHAGPKDPLSVPQRGPSFPIAQHIHAPRPPPSRRLRGAVCSPSSKSGCPEGHPPLFTFRGHMTMSGADKPPSEPLDLPIEFATTNRRPGAVAPRRGLGGVSTQDLAKPPAAV
jgi:hypothetical protein